MPESEPQKQGVAALGCRFSEKVEHVPIKKRRFMLRSPSPPPVIVSPTPEETVVPIKTEDISNRQVASKSVTCENNLDHNINNNISIDVKNPDNFDGKFGQDDDFSGISILAAAACSSSVGREYGYAEHGTAVKESPVLYSAPEVCTNTKTQLKEELLSSSEMSTGETLSCISTEPVGQPASNAAATCRPQEVIANGNYIKDIAMLAESLPSSGKASCSKDEDTLGSQQPSSRDERFHWDLNVVMDAWEEPLNDTDVHNYGPHDISQDAMNYNHDSHGKMTAACADQSLLIPGEPEPSSFQASGGSKSKQDETVRHYVDQHVRLDCQNMHSTDGLVATTLDPAFQQLVSGGLNEADNNTARTLNLNRDKRRYDQHGLEGFSSRVNADPNRAISMGFSEIPLVTPKESRDPSLGATSKTSLNKCMRYPEREENGVDAEYIDDASARRDAMAGTDAAGEVQEDYDSQYEDGELRESTECAWEEYDVVDREYEHVDYGSDNISTCITNHSDYHDSEPGQVEGSKNERRSLASFGGSYDDDNEVCKLAAKGVENDRENIIDNHENLGLSALEETELPRGTEQRENSKSCSDMVTGVTDDGRKVRLPPHVDEFVVSKGTETHDEPKMFRRALQSRIESPISRDGTSRDVRPYRMENRFDSGSTRSFERGRHCYHNQGRGRQSGSWDGPSDYRRGYKRQYSPVNYRRSKLGDDAVLERDSFGCDGRGDDLSFSHQHPNTRTNAVEEPCPSLQPRYNRPDKKFSPDRGAGFGRGRPFRYGPPLNDSRDGRGRGRGRYNSGPSSNESFQSSLKYRRPLSCRDRSHSPFGGRGQSNIYHSRGKSPSQSRSRSPIVWDSTRDRPGAGRGGRNFIRHRSRSPNFRSEVRMQRLRSPNQQPNFGADHATGFRTSARPHSSPPRNRWNSARKDEMEQFGEVGYKQRTNALERSPGRFRPRGDRDSIIDSPRNRKPDGYLKFSDRISEDGAGRGVRYAGTYEDRRKHNNFLRPARQSYEDGMGSRLHHDTDDSFSNTNDFRNRDGPRFRGRGGFRGTDRRIGDMRRRFSGEHQTFAYEKSNKFNSNSKEFTVDMMDKSCRRDRYASMDGANQGPRHDNYENRRQYSSTNFVQRSDNAGIEERSNHNTHQNFQDSSDFGGGHGRDLERRVGIVSPRSREDNGAIICEQEEKHDNLNSQLIGVQNSENDAIIGSAPS